ncbi:unnamed protein product, partial [Allacma fusca]
MSNVELICEKCRLPLAISGPATTPADPDDFVAMSHCRHLYHLRCILRMHQDSPYIDQSNIKVTYCEGNNCKKAIRGTEFFAIHHSTRPVYFPTENQYISELTMQLSAQRDYTSRMETAFINENLELRSRVREFQQEYSNLLMKYNKVLDTSIGKLFDNIRPMLHHSGATSSRANPNIPNLRMI